MKFLSELKSHINSPSHPTEVPVGSDWASVTSFFGKPLPYCYIQFLENYGSGEIDGWLTIFNPASENKNINLLQLFAPIMSGVSYLKSEFPETCPFPLLFEPGGLLPWASTIDGDVFCWLTSGNNAAWEIVVLCRHGEPEHFKQSPEEFMLNLFSGNISSAAVPENWGENTLGFQAFAL